MHASNSKHRNTSYIVRLRTLKRLRYITPNIMQPEISIVLAEKNQIHFDQSDMVKGKPK